MKVFSSVLAMVKGANGEFQALPALKGETPYEIAVRNGFEGTEDEWYNLSFDEGWVTKYQTLEANKASKTELAAVENGAYKKADSLSNYTKTELGLTSAATPDDALNAIMLSMAKKQIGTYVGTGAIGASNPNTLTFDFEAKFVFIVGYDTIGILARDPSFGLAIHFKGVSASGGIVTHTFPVTTTWADYNNSGTILEWSFTYQSVSNAYYQLNNSGTKYGWIALG